MKQLPSALPEALPHDLLRLADLSALRLEGPAPDWLQPALQQAPWVVVRRAAAAADWLAVGVRGATRAQRCAALLPLHAASVRLTPAHILSGWPSANTSEAALQALASVAGAWRELAADLDWGPGGSVGFQLASGVACVGPDSDLDLVVRGRLSVPRARQLLRALPELPVRIDIQLETPLGAVALTEYAAAGASLLLRRADGPQLLRQPWPEALAA